MVDKISVFPVDLPALIDMRSKHEFLLSFPKEQKSNSNYRNVLLVFYLFQSFSNAREFIQSRQLIDRLVNSCSEAGIDTAGFVGGDNYVHFPESRFDERRQSGGIKCVVGDRNGRLKWSR